MKLQSFATMDPHLLVGLVNTELRNQAESLEDLYGLILSANEGRPSS